MSHTEQVYSPTKDLREINARMKQMRNDNRNLLGPGVKSLMKMETLPEGWEVQWYGFVLDCKTDGSSRHIYREGNWKKDLYALTRSPLLDFWASAGGSFVRSNREDDGRDPYLVRYAVMGAVKGLDGQILTSEMSKEIDMRDGSEMAKSKTPGDLAKSRQNILQLAESKAQNRVIRALLGVNPSYTLEELTSGFVLMRLQFVPDMSDPMIKMLVTAQHIGAVEALYGGGQAMKMLMGGMRAITEVEDEPGRGAHSLPPKEEPTRQLSAAEAKPKQSAEDAMLDFTASSPAQQSDILATTMKVKGFGESKLKKPLTEFKAKDRLDLFKHLLTLADVEEDDAPAFSV